MKLQQLRYLVEVAKQGLNVSEAAEKLHTSQPGISKQIRLLEDELGIQVFIRNGKRVVAVSEPGQQVLDIAGRILREAQNLKRVGDEFAREEEGELTIATTHTQARYALPTAVQAFLKRYPKVSLRIKQGNPIQICEMVVAGEADFAVATESIDQFSELTALDCYQWNRSVVAPLGHPILSLDHPLTLADIAAWPIVTYDYAFAGRNNINRAFELSGIEPNIVLTAIDTDVIKTYVGLGLGVGIIATMAFEPERDTQLGFVHAEHLFLPSTTRIGIRRDAYLRGFAYHFIELFAPHLTRQVVDRSMRGGDDE
ncbi:MULTISPECIES: HTH-type transcriptional regulator CysB [Microvirgula]|uniref:HTH-type transcriptional regulator CysB n=1 Tax=Microvirgula aerodenitrificans TaxID=57480 RepID=A0A2S0PAA8_9NEIS|nr:MULTISPECIES: HTH-type transcriptional regulator CysB [Microvirgula]AVY94334.1 HTH-type transcriptional regulator CysB [Microvirgula aerodenitrificans]RAS19254.1 LysR family transcriptional regulator [Microvirgula sp. AG722]